jgi:TonB family protein
MRLVYRGTTLVRSWLSFAVSGCLHGSVLAWVILGGTGGPRHESAAARSIYDQEIRPYEKRIVWYSLQEKLPEIAPAGVRPDARPARARMKAPQTMVAGARDEARPAALIWAPEPEAAAPKELPLPNVVAVAPPKVVRPFVAPPERRMAAPNAAALPEAPPVAAADVKPVALPVVKPSGPARAFTPPPNVRMQRQAMLPLPEGPQPVMVVEPDALPFPTAGPRPQPRSFTPPPAKPGAVSPAAALPEAPAVSAAAQRRSLTAAAPIGTLPAMPRATPVLDAEPAPGTVGAVAQATLAIVGLNPAKITEVPAPPASRAAGFSAGPDARAEGGTGANGIALVNVPGLTVRGAATDKPPALVAGFSPTSKENLLAAARVGRGSAPNVPLVPRAAGAAEAPDPRFAGRAVYSIAIQMPNVTSFSGSWLVWFAESVPDPKRAPGGAPFHLQPPEVVRKVDPKYVAAAVAERVEGTVRLFAVIRKDGHVGGIAMLRNLDERLDRSAQEALAKWEFTPALRNGVAVDVDAIFEIPFHLAPRPKQ